MLILSRRPGEQIAIGKNILLEVLEILPDRVKIGFTAPRDIPIHRVELLNQDIGKEWRRDAGNDS